MTPAAVIFDLDGTLLDTEPDFTLLLNQLLLKHGKTAVEKMIVREMVSSGAGTLVRQGFALQQDDVLLQPLLEEFLQMYDQHIPQTQASLFEDIDVLIAQLHADGIPWAIMTNKARRFSAPLLKHFESFNTCAALVCPDDVGAGKPDPLGILSICKQLALVPEQTIYVGDHPRDIEAAKNAGMPGIAVRWGYLPPDHAIEEWGASFVADTPLQLAQYLKGMH
jgi:phosphoglycolate phosphatase